jgi:benzylsuccinate CoA-transferase BbsF subunit
MDDALAGVRILGNGIVQAGTFPARLLADFGAVVVRVENDRRPDLSRNLVFPDATPGERYWEQGGTYHEQHRNKDLCSGVDVGTAGGREAFLRLCMVCNAVLDSHPPGVLDRLGLGHADLRRVKPDLIVVTTSGYGHGGPYSAARSFGMMTELMCGMSWLNGYPGEAPRRGTFPFTDHETVYHIAVVILAALERRDRTGEGAWLDVSQYEVGSTMIGEAYVARGMGAAAPQRTGNADPPHPLAGCYRCRGSDAWITLSSGDRAAWWTLAGVIGRPDLAAEHDPWSRPLSEDERAAIERAIAAWAAHRSPHECLAALQGRGIAAGVVNDIRDLLLDPHLAERGFFWPVDHHPDQGAGRRAWPGPSARLAATPARLRRHASLLGEHNRPVLHDLLGYGGEVFTALLTDGGAGTVPLAAGVRPPARPTAERLKMSPWGYGRLKEYDAAFKQRLTERFGAGFGESSPVAVDGVEEGTGPDIIGRPSRIGRETS